MGQPGSLGWVPRIDIGWMKDPTWIVRTVEILMARRTKGYGIVRAIELEIDEVTVNQTHHVMANIIQ